MEEAGPAPQDTGRAECSPALGGRDHLVLLVGAEVEQNMQVLELAGWALEDQVSESGHAQISATLAGGRESGLDAPQRGANPGRKRTRSLTDSPATRSRLCAPSLQVPVPTSSRHLSRCEVLGAPHLILAVLANHLQGALGDQRRLQHHLSEDPAREEGRAGAAEKLPGPAGAELSGQGCPSHTACPTPWLPSSRGKRSRIRTLPAGQPTSLEVGFSLVPNEDS